MGLLEKILIPLIILAFVAGGGYLLYKAYANGAEQSAANASLGSSASGAQSASTSPALQNATATSSATTQSQTIMHAILHTNKGDIGIEFFTDTAPNTVANFVKLAESGFYDSTKFHRVIKGFMDQGGDPLTKDDSKQAQWGTGGPGYTIPDEISAAHLNDAGTIAMANTGQPNSGGSQFFLNAVDNHSLDGGYTVFGKVVSGMDVVTAINNVPTDSSDRPLDPVVLTGVTLAP